MSSFMQTLFWGLIRYVLRLRYRVQVIGAEQLRTVTGPTLVIRGIRTATITGRLLGSHSRLASVTPSRRETSDGYELRRRPGALIPGRHRGGTQDEAS